MSRKLAESNLMPAAVGLIGVIVGGIIAAGTAAWLDERRADRDDARAERNEVAEVQQAERVVAAEVFEIVAQLEILEAVGWHAQVIRRSNSAVLPDVAWREHGAVLARHLSAFEWTQVMLFYGNIGGLRRLLVDADVVPKGLRPPFSGSYEQGQELLEWMNPGGRKPTNEPATP